MGTSLAYAALIRGSASNIALFDVKAAKAEAEVLDLVHGTQFAGVALSLPSIVGRQGVLRVLDTPMDDGELAALQNSADTSQNSLSTLGL